MTIQACAEIVRRGDPDRFLAAMAAPPAARAVLFPLYAFNVEIARAPWVTTEPLIAQMRLQWWRDALAEIATRGVVRRHEVVTPLAQVIDAPAAAVLDNAVTARLWDVEGEAFADAAALWAHLEATGGGLMWTAARLLGAAAGDEAAVRAIARAGALANWFLAIPALEAKARRPLPDGRPQAVAALAREALGGLREARSGRAGRVGRVARVGRATRPATLAAWRARPLLRQAARDPLAVVEGRLAQSEFARRAGLVRARWLSGWP